MKQKIKKVFQFIANPRFLLCFGLGWIITNGWSYILFALGMALDIGWMKAVAGAYLAFLWLPISPEKIATCAIAIALLRWLFPNDQKTLAVLRDILNASRVDLSQIDDAELLAAMTGAADLIKYSLIVVATVPILCAYPFVQKYIEKGVMIGSVKG